MVETELSHVIAKLRDDLEVAMEAGEGRRLRFELGPVQVSLSVTITSTDGGKAGVRFWVVEAGIDGSVSHASGHQITLTLNPKEVLAPDVSNASPGSPLIRGEVLPGEVD